MKRLIVTSVIFMGVALVGAGCNKATIDNTNSSPVQDKSTNNNSDDSKSSSDTDGDGLSDAEEISIGTNPTKIDTDGDSYSDKVEVDKGYDPLKSPAGTSQPGSSLSTYANLTFHYSLNYPEGWKKDVIGLDPELEGIVEFSPPFGSAVKESVKVQVSTGQGYTSASTEQSLKDQGINFNKDQIQVGGVKSTRFSYSSSRSLGATTYSERDVTVYVPGKGENGSELLINGHCTTFGVPSPGTSCSTSVDDIINQTIVPSFKFTAGL